MSTKIYNGFRVIDLKNQYDLSDFLDIFMNFLNKKEDLTLKSYVIQNISKNEVTKYIENKIYNNNLYKFYLNNINKNDNFLEKNSISPFFFINYENLFRKTWKDDDYYLKIKKHFEKLNKNTFYKKEFDYHFDIKEKINDVKRENNENDSLSVLLFPKKINNYFLCMVFQNILFNIDFDVVKLINNYFKENNIELLMEGYFYFNNTEKPEEISDLDWEKRRIDWNLFDLYKPVNQISFSCDFINENTYKNELIYTLDSKVCWEDYKIEKSIIEKKALLKYNDGYFVNLFQNELNKNKFIMSFIINNGSISNEYFSRFIYLLDKYEISINADNLSNPVYEKIIYILRKFCLENVSEFKCFYHFLNEILNDILFDNSLKKSFVKELEKFKL